MARKGYDENKVVRVLNKNFSVNVDSVNKTIETIKDSSTIGNGTFGKIDFLVHYKGYTHIYVDRIKGKRSPVEDDGKPSISVNIRGIKDTMKAVKLK